MRGTESQEQMNKTEPWKYVAAGNVFALDQWYSTLKQEEKVTALDAFGAEGATLFTYALLKCQKGNNFNGSAAPVLVATTAAVAAPAGSDDEQKESRSTNAGDAEDEEEGGAASASEVERAVGGRPALIERHDSAFKADKLTVVADTAAVASAPAFAVSTPAPAAGGVSGSLFAVVSAAVGIESNRHILVATWLLSKTRALLTRPYAKGSDYDGENALHMAIAKGDLDVVKWLLQTAAQTREERYTLLHGRAVGKFFAQLKGHSLSGHYGGELPLSFAVSLNKLEMIQYLLEGFGDRDVGGAPSLPRLDLSLGDAAGNTAGHVAAYYGYYDAWRILKLYWDAGFGRPRHYQSITFGLIANFKGCSPLVVAARQKHIKMFERMWREDNFRIHWKWGGKTCRLFPLYLIDHTPRTFVPAGESEAGKLQQLTPTALHRLFSGDTERDAEREVLDELRASEAAAGRSTAPSAAGTAKPSDDISMSPRSVFARLGHHSPLRAPMLVPPSPRSLPDTASITSALSVLPAATSSGVIIDNAKVSTITTVHKTVFDVMCEDSITEIIIDEHILTLVRLKWHAFALPLFLLTIFFDLLFLGIFMAMTIARSMLPDDRVAFHCPHQEEAVNGGGSSSCTWVIFCESFVVVVSTFFFLEWVATRICLRRESAFNVGAIGTKLTAAVLRDAVIILAFILEGSSAGQAASRYVWSIAAVLAWSHSIFWLLAIETTGKFVVILSEAVLHDILPISFILILIYLGFTQSFVALTYSANAPKDIEGEEGAHLFRYLARILFRWIVDPGYLENTGSSGDNASDSVFLVWGTLFQFFVGFVIISLLVSKINDTFIRVSTSSTALWNLERARLILMYEARLPECILLSEQMRYWVDRSGLPFLRSVEKDEIIYTPHQVAQEVEVHTKAVKEGKVAHTKFIDDAPEKRKEEKTPAPTISLSVRLSEC